MSTTLRSLLIGFAIETEGESKLDAIDAKIEGIAAKFRMVGAAIAGAFIVKGLTSFITDTIEAGSELSLTAQKLGVTVDELERYRYAANLAGVENQAAERALMMFNRQLGEAELGTKAATKGVGELTHGYTAQQLAAMPLNDLMVVMADRFQGITDKGQKTQLAMKLFGRQGAALIPMFEGGSANMKLWMEQFDALGGGIGGDLAEQTRFAEQGLKRLSFTFNVLKTRIVGDVLPGVEKLVNGFAKLVIGLEYLQKKTYLAQTAIIALCAAAVIALAPFLAGIAPIVAAATAIYLVFDDIYTLFNGGRSVIGTWLKDLYGMEGAKTIVKDVKAAFADFIDWIKNVGAPIVRDFVHNLTTFAAGSGVRDANSDWRAFVDTLKQAYHFLNASHKIAVGDFEGAGKEWNIATGQDSDALKNTPDDQLDPDSDEFQKRMAAYKEQGRLDTLKLHFDQAAKKGALVSPEVLQQRLADRKAQREQEDRDREQQKEWQDQMTHAADLGESGGTVNNITVNAPITLHDESDVAPHLAGQIQDLLYSFPVTPNTPIPAQK